MMSISTDTSTSSGQGIRGRVVQPKDDVAAKGSGGGGLPCSQATLQHTSAMNEAAEEERPTELRLHSSKSANLN